MTYRISIIISLLLLGIVMLYLRKKEGWNWDKVALVFSVTLIIIAICASMGIFIYIKMSAKPVTQTSFWDLNLDSSRASIEFLKGPPIEVTDDGFWIYMSKIKGDPEIYFLKFMNETLWVVGYLGGGINGGPGLQGFKQGSSVDDIETFFGKPSQVIEIQANHSNLYLYDKYNVFFVVKGNQVSFYGAYNSIEGPFSVKESFENQISQMVADPLY
jgi:hypothetical protein